MPTRLGCFYVTAILSWGCGWVEFDIEAESWNGVELRLRLRWGWVELGLSLGWGELSGGWIKGENELS